MKKVAIVTPTILSDIKKLERCVNSVKNQTYDNLRHILIIDGFMDKEVLSYIGNLIGFDVDVFFTNKEKSNTWGAYPRQWFLDNVVSESPDEYEYVVYLDDDNYIFPEYVEEMVAAIEGSDVSGSICKIYHHGPVSHKYFKNYAAINNDDNIVCVVSGNPPVYQNIDTLNVMVRISELVKYGWVCKSGDQGYCNDGETYERLFQNISYVYVNKILGIHY